MNSFWNGFEKRAHQVSEDTPDLPSNHYHASEVKRRMREKNPGTLVDRMKRNAPIGAGVGGALGTLAAHAVGAGKHSGKTGIVGALTGLGIAAAGTHQKHKFMHSPDHSYNPNKRDGK